MLSSSPFVSLVGLTIPTAWRFNLHIKCTHCFLIIPFTFQSSTFAYVYVLGMYLFAALIPSLVFDGSVHTYIAHGQLVAARGPLFLPSLLRPPLEAFRVLPGAYCGSLKTQRRGAENAVGHRQKPRQTKFLISTSSRGASNDYNIAINTSCTQPWCACYIFADVVYGISCASQAGTILCLELA